MIELAGAARALRILKAPNAEAVRRHKDRAIVQINLVAHGDDTEMKPRRGNPFAYSYDGETENNPANVWALKRLRDDVAGIFRSSVLDNLVDMPLDIKQAA